MCCISMYHECVNVVSLTYFNSREGNSGGRIGTNH